MVGAASFFADGHMCDAHCITRVGVLVAENSYEAFHNVDETLVNVYAGSSNSFTLVVHCE